MEKVKGKNGIFPLPKKGYFLGEKWHTYGATSSHVKLRCVTSWDINKVSGS